LLETNLDKIDWKKLSGNPAATTLLSACNPILIDRSALSGNPSIMKLMDCSFLQFYHNKLNGTATKSEYTSFRLDWGKLSSNPNALPLLKLEPQSINWKTFSFNPNLFASSYRSSQLNKLDQLNQVLSKIDPFNACLLVGLMVSYNCLTILIKQYWS